MGVYILISSSNDSAQFSYFVDLCEKIRTTSSTNIKVNIISEYLSSLSEESLSIAVLFFSNRIFPRGSKFTLNIGFSIIMQVLSEIASLDPNQIQQIYLRHGDIGALSEYAISKKHMASLFQQHAITLSFIHNRLERI